MRTVTFQGNPLHLEGELPQVGAKAPEFTLTAQDLSSRSLKDYCQKITVLISVPSLDTPVCDLEIKHFNTLAKDLSKDVVLVCVSRDLPFAQARWCGASGAKAIETLSDYRDGSFGKTYGVYLKELDLLARAVILLDGTGTVRYIQLVPEVASEPDYAAVLEEIKKLI